MILFADYYVRLALKEASKKLNLPYKERTNYILNCYPKEKII